MERIIPQENLLSSRSNSVKGGTSSREQKGDLLERPPPHFSSGLLTPRILQANRQVKDGFTGFVVDAIGDEIAVAFELELGILLDRRQRSQKSKGYPILNYN